MVRPSVRTEKEIRKEQKSVEKPIAQLDAQKRSLQEQFANSTDDEATLRLETELNAVTTQLAEAEDRWSQLYEEVEGLG